MTSSSDLGVERTLVLLKPDTVARGLAGQIIARFEAAALKIVGTKMRQMDAEFARKHYFDLEERAGIPKAGVAVHQVHLPGTQGRHGP